jgi:5-methylcytosine-specific restriction endonuclease McrA
MGVKITELACKSTFDEFFDALSQSQAISRQDANEKYLTLRKNAQASSATRAKAEAKRKPKRFDAYQAYVRSKAWAAKRNQAIEAAGHKCQTCGSREALQVHHLTYKRLKNEPVSDLRVLCADCHKNAHESDGKAVSDSTAAFMRMARRF